MYKKQTMKLSSSRQVDVYLPETCSSKITVIYALDGSKMVPGLISYYEQSTEAVHPVLVSLPDDDRLNDYTPWPAPALSERFADFGGKGWEFLHWIESEVKGEVEKAAAKAAGTSVDTIAPFESVLLGYSLGGLLAVYASFLTDTFEKIVTISGSFWYPEWDTFIENHVPINPKTKYLMLYGLKEGNGKKSIQKSTLERSKLTYRLLCDYTSAFPLYEDEGGHHEHVNERLCKAAQWIVAIK